MLISVYQQTRIEIKETFDVKVFSTLSTRRYPYHPYTQLYPEQ